MGIGKGGREPTLAPRLTSKRMDGLRLGPAADREGAGLRGEGGCHLTTPHKLRPEARWRNCPGWRLGAYPLRKPTAEDVSFMR
jgi:hypothetical protein